MQEALCSVHSRTGGKREEKMKRNTKRRVEREGKETLIEP